MGLPMCHRGMNKFRGSSPDHVQPPPTLLSYPGLCVVPHLEHIITHHTIPHVASPSPGPPLGSEAPLLPPLLAACGVTCISASASPPAWAPQRLTLGQSNAQQRAQWPAAAGG